MAEQIQATVLQIGTAAPLLESQSWSFPVQEIAIEEVLSGDINAGIRWLGDIYYVSDTLADLVAAANAGGGSGGVTIYTGDGSLRGDREIGLEGHSLKVEQDGNYFVTVDPTVDNETTQIAARNVGSGAYSLIQAITNSGIGAFQLNATGRVDSGVYADITAFSDDSTSTTIITYTAGNSVKGTHRFDGVLNLLIQSAPASPNYGDIWREDNTNTGVKIRINGVTKTITVS